MVFPASQVNRPFFKCSQAGCGLLILTGSSVQVRISMEDADLEKAEENVRKQKKLLEKEVDRTQQKLGNSDFVARAPAEVLTEHRERLKRETQKIQLFQEALGHIEVHTLDRNRNERS